MVKSPARSCFREYQKLVDLISLLSAHLISPRSPNPKESSASSYVETLLLQPLAELSRVHSEVTTIHTKLTLDLRTAHKRAEMLLAPELFLLCISGWCTMAASTPTSAGATAAPQLAQTYLVSDAPGLDGLVPACLDGSTPRYWFQPSPTMSTKWAIHMQGGGWCESLEDCARRAYSPSQCLIGSSSPQCFAPRGTEFNTSMDLVSRAQDDLQVLARVDQIHLPCHKSLASPTHHPRHASPSFVCRALAIL